MSRCQLHAPATEIVYRRNTRKMREAISKYRSRQANFVGEAIEGPLTHGLAMNQSYCLPGVEVAFESVSEKAAAA